MLTVVIKDDGEDNVIKLTYDNIWREIKDIPGSQILVSKHWFDALGKVNKNGYVCFVESDCLVSSGYFSSQLGILEKDKQMRKIAVMSSSTAVKNWANRIYGYEVNNEYTNEVVPLKEKKSKYTYAVEVAYIPGSILRKTMLQRLYDDMQPTDDWEKDLVYFSTQLSLGFWGQNVANGMGNMVYINPNASYATTEEYVNDISKFDPEVPEIVAGIFKKQRI